jgi:hypothetical protein
MKKSGKKFGDFVADIRTLIKLQPLMFFASVIGTGYGVATMIIGSVKLSYFIGVTGAAAVIFGVFKLYALKRYAAAGKVDDILSHQIQNTATKNVAIAASVMSFLHFSIAFVCTFFEEETPANYGLWFVFFVAGAAFIKLTVSIVNAVLTRKNRNIVIHHAKLIDVANALIALGLTQRAILYYLSDAAARLLSGLGGMVFSLLALFVCLLMFIKYRHSAVTENPPE